VQGIKLTIGGRVGNAAIDTDWVALAQIALGGMILK
jgi:hypothetical protein